MVRDIGIDLGGDSGPRLGIESMVFRLVVTSGRRTGNLFLENGSRPLVADAPTTLANGGYLLNGHGDPPGNHRINKPTDSPSGTIHGVHLVNILMLDFDYRVCGYRSGSFLGYNHPKPDGKAPGG